MKSIEVAAKSVFGMTKPMTFVFEKHMLDDGATLIIKVDEDEYTLKTDAVLDLIHLMTQHEARRG